MRAVAVAALAFVLGAGLSCSDSDPGVPASPPRAFLFAIRGLPESEGNFIAVTSDPVVLRRLEVQLALPPDSRNLHIHGPVATGDGGHNAPWSWHFVPGEWDVVEVSIELCDGTPADVEADPAGWMDQAGAFCPWGSYVVREL